jgi:ketosteroid isomerase-like protein
MGAEENRKAVQLVYEAFNRGEIDVVFDALTEDTVWTNHSGEGTPHNGVFYRKSGVQQFFSHFDRFDLDRFDIRDIVAVDDTVILVIDSKTTVKASGKSAEQTLVHIMTLKDGKLGKWDEYEDEAHNPWV